MKIATKAAFAVFLYIALAAILIDLLAVGISIASYLNRDDRQRDIGLYLDGGITAGDRGNEFWARAICKEPDLLKPCGRIPTALETHNKCVSEIESVLVKNANVLNEAAMTDISRFNDCGLDLTRRTIHTWFQDHWLEPVILIESYFFGVLLAAIGTIYYMNKSVNSGWRRLSFVSAVPISCSTFFLLPGDYGFVIRLAVAFLVMVVSPAAILMGRGIYRWVAAGFPSGKI